jgi:hypothetical protein
MHNIMKIYLHTTLFAVYLLSRPAVFWLWLLSLVGGPVAAELEKHI